MKLQQIAEAKQQWEERTLKRLLERSPERAAQPR
jgi:hypothetical protein